MPSIFGSIPELDSELKYENLIVRVTDADEQKTNEVLVTVLPPEEESDNEEEAEASDEKENDEK